MPPESQWFGLVLMIVEYPSLRQALARLRDAGRRIPPGYEADAVCLLLFERDQTMLLAIQKADNEGYHWRRQVALPGGHIEAADRSAEDAALRELREELGIVRTQVEVLGSLGHFRTQSSRNDLEVIVGHWVEQTGLRPDRREIERVLELPLAGLLESHLRAGFRGRSIDEIGDDLIYPLEDTHIWGVTARILHHFLETGLDKGALGAC